MNLFRKIRNLKRICFSVGQAAPEIGGVKDMGWDVAE